MRRTIISLICVVSVLFTIAAFGHWEFPENTCPQFTERFTDNGDGTVTDNTSDLIWLKDANCFGRLNWNDAVAIAADLAEGQCGLMDGSVAGDWGLAERTELLTLFVCRRHFPALGNSPDADRQMEKNCFSKVQSDFYWSSTSDALTQDTAWLMRLDPDSVNYGQLCCECKTALPHGVWPVRCRK